MLTAAVLNSLPILLAAMGGIISEQSGKTNIALEGFLLSGAFTAIIVFQYTQLLGLALFSAMLVPLLFSTLMSMLIIRLRSNLFITAAAFNILIPGLLSVLLWTLQNNSGMIRVEAISELNNPVLGYLLLALAVCLMMLLSLLFRFSHAGRVIRGTGSQEEMMRQMGYPVEKIQIGTLAISGIFCGLGGALLSLRLGIYIPGIIAGKGWVALIAVLIGRKRPLLTIMAVLVFSLAESLGNALQIFPDFPSDILRALPYILTLAALIFYALAKIFYHRRAGYRNQA